MLIWYYNITNWVHNEYHRSFQLIIPNLGPVTQLSGGTCRGWRRGRGKRGQRNEIAGQRAKKLVLLFCRGHSLESIYGEDYGWISQEVWCPANKKIQIINIWGISILLCSVCPVLIHPINNRIIGMGWDHMRSPKEEKFSVWPNNVWVIKVIKEN